MSSPSSGYDPARPGATVRRGRRAALRIAPHAGTSGPSAHGFPALHTEGCSASSIAKRIASPQTSLRMGLSADAELYPSLNIRYSTRCNGRQALDDHLGR